MAKLFGTDTCSIHGETTFCLRQDATWGCFDCTYPKAHDPLLATAQAEARRWKARERADDANRDAAKALPRRDR